MNFLAKTSNHHQTGTDLSMKPHPSPPDPEVLEKKPRRRFTAKYKLGILSESMLVRSLERFEVDPKV